MPQPPRTPLTAPARHTAAAIRFMVRILPSQLQFEAAPDETLLAAAERSGIALPSSCRNGTCRTCLCAMPSGSVRYAVEWPGLSAEEKATGYILPCVALATADLVLEQPEASRSAQVQPELPVPPSAR